MKKSFKNLLLLLILCSFLNAKDAIVEKKILYINSYHQGLYWSDGIEKSIKEILLKSNIPINIKTFYMNTKNIQNVLEHIEIALKAKEIIDSFKPDVVILSDDNALKYVYEPYYYKSKIPFVFCGINGSSSKYSLGNNITGMEEVQLVPQLIKALKEYANKETIGYLKGDSLSSHEELKFFEYKLGLKIDARFVNNVDEWKTNFIDLQKNVGILLIGNGGAVKHWKDYEDEISIFVHKNIEIPIGTWDLDISNLAVLSLITKPEEQGNWSARVALRILNGEKPSDIKIVNNKESKIFINTTLAKKLNIVFPFDFIDNAELLR